MTFTEDNVVKIILGLLIFAGTVFGWFFGKRQEVAAAKDKAEKDAKNAAATAQAAQAQAEAAQQNADVALLNAALMGGKETLKTLLDGAKSIQDLTKQVQEQAEQLGAFKYSHAQELGELKLKHQTEIAGLQAEIQRLGSELTLLRKELELKDAALADCGQVRAERDRLEKEKALLLVELEDYKRANSAFIYLWQAAAEGRGDTGQVNIAEQAITRILTRSADTARDAVLHGEAPPVDSNATVSAVAVTVAARFHEGDGGTHAAPTAPAPPPEQTGPQYPPTAEEDPPPGGA